ncbi:hypothetical protein [Paraburkholderia metrosideri]|jgi:hypothetical protein|uniref:Uncharacterized protein n=1 Tax=Paraburkholderia metrosideri TaxID=580937 RepID=A0ABN7HC62_9BURK|nr:hypothetical protein [Paraburkholderia metrosideri]CAD6507655.1 hypothetical protein LMG28140_00084 [Paraburkholderia metrosideri]
MEFLLTCFAVGILVAIPLWIVWQRLGSRRALAAMRGFDPRDAVPCDIEAVALGARLLPDAPHTGEAAR